MSNKQTTLSNTEGADRQLAVKKMNTATLAKHKSWQTMSMQSNKTELANNWQKALDVKELEEKPDKYSDHAATLLFDANDMDRHTLRLYRNVARYFTDKEIQNYLKHNEANPFTPVRWTHLIYLSNVNDDAFRKKMIKGIKAEGWSCNTVSKECDEFTKINPDSANRPAQRLKPTNAMKKIAKHSKELVTSLVGIEDDAFVDRLDSIKPADIDKTLEHVENAEQMLNTLEQSLQERRAIITSTKEKLIQRKTLLASKTKGKKSLSGKAPPSDAEISKSNSFSQDLAAPEDVDSKPVKKVIKKVLRKKA